MDNKVYNLYQRHHADKALGKKHFQLHTLKECCEVAGITPQRYGKLCVKYANQPRPQLITKGKGNTNAKTQHFRRDEVLAYIKDCLEKETDARKTS